MTPLLFTSVLILLKDAQHITGGAPTGRRRRRTRRRLGLRLRKLDGLAGHKRRRARAAERVVELRHGVAQELVDLADPCIELLLQLAVEVARGERGRGVGRVEREEEAADAFDEMRAPLEAQPPFRPRELV